MAVAARATDKLDAICIGASVEALFAACSLAAAGKTVRILDPDAPGVRAGLSAPCLADVEAVNWLDLVSHGLRYGAVSPLVAVAQERPLVIWPEQDATVAGLAGLSARDAAAFPGFASGILRQALAANHGGTGGSASPLGLGARRDPLLAQVVQAQSTSLSRLLEEAFVHPLLCGALAQHALAGTAVSPTLAGSARLLARQSMLALLGHVPGKRFVAGGTAGLLAALGAALKAQGSLEVQHEVRVRQLILERDAIQGVVLADGTALRAPQVILGLQGDAALELLEPLPFEVPAALRPVFAGRIRYTAAMPPAIRGLGAGTMTSGATVLLNPSLDRLARSHGALMARQAQQDYCLSVRINPIGRMGSESDGRMSWEVITDIPNLPRETEEGPWSGSRRERLVSAVTRMIDAWAPGFELSLKTAELVLPAEPRPFLERQKPLSGLVAHHGEVPVLPDVGHDGVWKIGRGLWLASESFSAGSGRAGLSIARALGAVTRPKGAVNG